MKFNKNPFYFFYILLLFPSLCLAKEDKILSLFGFDFETAPSTIPYQKNCNPESIDITKKLDRLVDTTKETEASYCFNCNKTTKPARHKSESFIPRECFLTIALRGEKTFIKRRYAHCSSIKDSQPDSQKQYCINKDYIDTIHKAFHIMSRCFGYKKENQEALFHLIHQESKGILNAVSPTGARCLGQITSSYVSRINRLIERNTKPEIYTSFLERCPQLKDKVLAKIDNLTCHTTQDPHTCLFYTIFGFTENQNYISKNLNSPSNFIEKIAFSEQERRLFKLPIKRNEVLKVQIQVGKNSFSWLFWDDSELHKALDILEAQSDHPSTKLTVKKAPLFKNQKDVELMFNYWAYNGGTSISRYIMTTMIDELKKSLIKKSEKCKASTNCNLQLRNQILKKEGLSSEAVLTFFENYLLKNYPSKKQSRKEEVAHYVRKLIDTNHFVFTNRHTTGIQKHFNKFCPKIYLND